MQTVVPDIRSIQVMIAEEHDRADGILSVKRRGGEIIGEDHPADIELSVMIGAKT